MKKLKLDVEALEVEQFQAEPPISQDKRTVYAFSGWYSDPCRYCGDFPISMPPNSPC